MNGAVKILLFIVIYISSLVCESESYNVPYLPGTFDNITSARFKRQDPAQTSFGKCRTPPQPEYGSWNYADNLTKGTPNIYVPSRTIIVFTCQKNYKLSTTNEDELLVSCGSNGEWKISKLPECEQLCAPIYNKDHYNVSCRNKEGSVVPCDKATDYTVMTFKCEPYFEKAPGLEASIYCMSGTWENTPKCVSACGRKRVDDSSEIMIIKGKSVKRGDYPWSVALYKTDSNNPDQYSSYEHICGGTLLSTNVVLTAAHCVTIDYSGEPIRPNVFRVAAGKYYNAFEDPRDNDTARFSEIEDIKVHTDYGGSSHYFRDDIALLKLKTNLVPSQVVQPVCLQGLDDLPALKPNDNGLVTGWGFTETNGKPSETLKEVELPYIDVEECRKQLNRDFAHNHLYSSTICAGLLNNNAGVCYGDSGGGLVFRYNNRYFIRGIVSVSQTFPGNDQKMHCNVQRAAVFTKVESYYQWIRRTMLEWSFIHQDNNSTAMLEFCPPIYNKDHYTVSCKNKEGSVVPCDKATEYTVLTFKCEPYFENAPGLEASIYCVNGTWENTPKCVQVCGEKRVTAESLIVNGHEVERGNYPWMVALYSSENLDPDYGIVCGGSLLATNVVLTAASCVTKKKTGKIVRKEFLRVAAGKYYRDFEDTRDTDTAQFSEIETILVHEDYKGEVSDFRNDIALLKLKTNLVLSKVVQPVCFKDLEGLPALKSNAEGLVTGWGYTKSNGKPSETLKEVHLTSIPLQQCSSELPQHFAEKFLTPEKICARLLNNNTILCKGDAGGGLVFRSKEYKNRFFVHGVSALAVSFVKNQEEHCDVERPLLFTNVGKYYHWIRDTVLQWTNDI